MRFPSAEIQRARLLEGLKGTTWKFKMIKEKRKAGGTLRLFPQEIEAQNTKGFNVGVSTHDYFGTSPTFFFVFCFSYPIAFSEFKWLVYKRKDCLNYHKLFLFYCIQREDNLSIINLSEKYDLLNRAIARVHRVM